MRFSPAFMAAAFCLMTLPACGQDAPDAQTPAAETPAPVQEAEAAPAPPQIATPAPAPDFGPAASPDAAVLGDADAPVEIVEYASTTCPYCAVFHTQMLPHIKANWIDAGHARLVLRPLPTQPIPLAVAGFQLARCAGDDRYFDVLDTLFETQEDLFEAAQAGDIQAYYEGVAEAGGLEPARLPDCFGDEAGLRQINASIESAQEYGITGTPSFLIDGQVYSAGELNSAAAWDTALQRALDASAD